MLLVYQVPDGRREMGRGCILVVLNEREPLRYGGLHDEHRAVTVGVTQYEGGRVLTHRGTDNVVGMSTPRPRRQDPCHPLPYLAFLRDHGCYAHHRHTISAAVAARTWPTTRLYAMKFNVSDPEPEKEKTVRDSQIHRVRGCSL